MHVNLVGIQWSESLSIYASEAFLRSLSEDFGWLGGVDGDGTQRYVLPFVRFRKAGLDIVRFSTETICVGNAESVEKEQEFLDRAVNYFREAGVDVIIPATFTSLFRTYPHTALAAEYGTFVVRLDQPEAVIWNGLHQKHRNVIRNAEKKGVTVRLAANDDRKVFDLVRRSFERSSGGIFGCLKVRLRMRGHAFIRQTRALGTHAISLIAEHEGLIQGCAVIHFSQHSGYYMHGGTTDHPVTGAMNLLHWEAIKRLRAMGVAEYNFVGARLNPEPGSKQEGLLRFKARFGGELRQGYMWKCYLNPRRARLYRCLSMLRSGGDVVDQIRRAAARRVVEPVRPAEAGD